MLAVACGLYAVASMLREPIALELTGEPALANQQAQDVVRDSASKNKVETY